MDVLLVLIAVFIAFYVILLRPVMQEQRKRRQDLSALELGDEVLTVGGLFAFVRDIQTTEDGPMVLTLELAPGVLVRGTTDAVQQVVRSEATTEPDEAAVEEAEPEGRD